MNEEQRIAFVQAQVMCAQIKLQGMVSANIQASITRDRHEKFALPYQQDDFDRLIEEFGLDHNTVMSTLTGR